MNPTATVLVVDDDVVNITIVAHLLEPEFDVIIATNGPQALQLAADVAPDLVLLDVVMPGMDGHAVCVRLKADPRTAAIPVIFITGLQDPESESRGLELGAVDYVTKPFNAAVVRARVRNNIELKRARDRLLWLAASDGLTGLANRRSFDATLATEWKRLTRTHAPLALVMLDIDFFKDYNDLYGHIAGDDCLRHIAGAMQAAIQRPADVAARYGGEEFACILPDTDLAGGLALAERIRDNLRALAIPHAASAAGPIVSASIGVACSTCSNNAVAESLVRAADTSLYAAKAAGRNRIRCADAA